jgi:hypothetical protein
MVPLVDRSSPGAPPLSATAHACLTCGLVWTHVDADRLRTVLREAGTAETRRQLAAEDGNMESKPAG